VLAQQMRLRCGSRAPNTRVQRTRSSPSARHEPLTRHPLGRLRICVCAVVLGFVLPLGAFVEAQPDEWKRFDVSGWGGLPLSDTVTALWLDGPKIGSRPDPLLMVYFRGPAGWHNRKWDSDAHFGSSPAWIRLTSPDLSLSIEFDKPFKRMAVQGEPVDLKEANVFLVSPVGVSGSKATVQALGFVSLDMPADATPPLVVFERRPDIKRAVMGIEK
jgi:hypothetical protein